MLYLFKLFWTAFKVKCSSPGLEKYKIEKRKFFRMFSYTFLYIKFEGNLISGSRTSSVFWMQILSGSSSSVEYGSFPDPQPCFRFFASNLPRHSDSRMYRRYSTLRDKICLMEIPMKDKSTSVPFTGYTQSGNFNFLAYIPSWWKN